LSKLQTLQQQLSSGKAIARPSDSPTGTVAAMQIRSDQARTTQYSRNASDGIAWLGTADQTLTSLLDSVRRVRDLTLQGMNAATDQNGRDALATEVGSIREELLNLANTTFEDKPIFAGTAAVPTAYDSAGNYLGNTAALTRTVGPGTRVEVSVAGSGVFGTPGADLFAVVNNIAGDLSSNPANLGAGLDALDAAMKTVEDALAGIGSRYNRVQTMQSLADDRLTSLTSDLAEVESVDLPKTIMDLQMQQVAYQSALGATSRVLQPTLMDYLK
jgi:flagellar hook-associated protein 3 FlgL